MTSFSSLNQDVTTNVINDTSGDDGNFVREEKESENMEPSKSGTSTPPPPPPPSIIKTALTQGFTSLSAFDKKPTSTILLPNPDHDISRAKVQFVDPSSSIYKQKAKKKGNIFPSYFSLIDNIFRRDHDYTLRNIPYQNVRNGSMSSIEAVQIECIKMESAIPSAPTTASSSSSTIRNHSADRPRTGEQNQNSSAGTNQSALALLFGRGRPTVADTGSAGGGSGRPSIISSTNSSNSTNSKSSIPKSTDDLNPPTKAISVSSDPSSESPTTSPSTTDTRKSITNIISDATCWHMGHYCHVYIAACENLEHYRTKVRPSLQAFVSQIDSNHLAMNQNPPNSSSNSNSHHVPPNLPPQSGTSSLKTSSQYVIIYIPIQKQHKFLLQQQQQQQQQQQALAFGLGGGGAGGGTGVTGGLVRARAAASLAAHRATSAVRNSTMSSDGSVTGSTIDDLTVHSSHSHQGGGGSVVGVVGGYDGGGGNGNMAADLSLLTSKEKEVFKKLMSDFPKGRISVLSTLFLTDGAGGGSGMSIMTPAQTATHQQEWNIFMRNLGSAIVAGFQDRFGQYDDHLRNLDKRRALATSKSGSSFMKKMDLTNYFLVKESLAFSYEQMQLHSEALLQYEEISVVVPSALWNGGDPTSVNNDSELAVAATGETTPFRSKIRSNQVTEIEVHHYLFCREIHLLFKLHKPVDVIARAHQHIQFLDNMKRTNEVRSDPLLLAELEASGLSACWDVKCACDIYFSFSTNASSDKSKFLGIGKRKMSGIQSMRNIVSGVARGTVAAEKERDASKKLSSLLEFARLRLLLLGDKIFSKNPVRLAGFNRPLDTFEEWPPWEEIHQTEKNSLDEEVKNGDHTYCCKMNVTEIPAVKESEWLREALYSQASYETRYLELSGSIITLYQHAGFPRLATRLLMERAEILISRKDHQSAVRILSKIVDSTPVRDQLWDKIYLWRLFRLACCQRMSSDWPISYLKTLVRCFTSRLARITPLKTAILFQRDLEALIKEKRVSECSLSISPLFEIELLVSPLNGKNGSTYSQHPLGFLRKKLTKYTCSVGDTMSINLFISSSLPKTVKLDRLRLFLVTYEKYEKAYHRSNNGRNKYQGVNILETDAHRILPIDDDIVIKPGRNEFKFDWTPMTVGQFALASMDMQWSNAAFFHDSSTFRRPIQGIEVVPSAPTQTIELNPLFLIPGHEQEIRFVFSSGEDIVESGVANFSCSEGLKILVPGADPMIAKSWRKSCRVEIEPCDPGSSSLITTLVKSTVVPTESGKKKKKNGGVQTIKANVQTLYHHSLYKKQTEDGDEPKSKPMATELNIRVTTLDRPALSVDRTSAVALSDDQVIVSVALHCNTPLPFFLKEWNISLPPPLIIEKDGDLNKGLFENPIALGEEIFFGFSCKRQNNEHHNFTEGRNRPTLHVVLQDEIGKTFNQVFHLDLDEFYRKMWKEVEFAGMNTARAILKCSSGEGVVGAPVYFTFDVDISNLVDLEKRLMTTVTSETKFRNSSTLLYSISFDENDWILSGRVQGAVEHSLHENGIVSFSLDFVGIPTRSGLLTNFPKINMFYNSMANGTMADDDSGLPPIVVHCDFPESFRSLPYTNLMALATPTLVEKISPQN